LKKNIYIVGGSGLIGSDLVKQLDEKNNNLIVIDKKKINQKSIKNIKYVNLDVSNLRLFEKKIKNIFKKNGRPTSMINCSYPKTSDWKNNDFKRINFETYSKNISIHLNSYVWISKIFIDEMVKNKSQASSIVLLSSIYGFLGQNFNLYKDENIRENLTYSVIKGGIINAVRSFSSYYGKYSIRINSVSPGGIFDNQNKSFVKKYSKQVPLNRMALKDEISKVIKFLVSEESSYITGQNIVVDGGYSII
jgi:NAD(P)-dependent dehydrogenase (short-subunit alcohol dehydrogenase family)